MQGPDVHTLQQEVHGRWQAVHTLQQEVQREIAAGSSAGEGSGNAVEMQWNAPAGEWRWRCSGTAAATARGRNKINSSQAAPSHETDAATIAALQAQLEDVQDEVSSLRKRVLMLECDGAGKPRPTF